MATLKDIEKRIKAIEERNKRVEYDKSWEISLTRRALLVAFTYIAVGSYMMAIGIPDPWLNAIVPAIAFMLSTLTIPIFKRLWLNHVYKKGSKES